MTSLRIIGILCICFLTMGMVIADDISVTASVSRQTAYIGDLIDYTITVNYSSGITVTPPAAGKNLGQFDVKDYRVGEEKELDGDRREQNLWFEMRTFTTGEYVIPSLEIEYFTVDSTRKVISSDPIKINIKSVIADGSESDTLQIRDIKEQASLKSGLPLWAVLTLVGAIIGGMSFLIWWWLKRQQREEEEYVDPRPAWEIAFTDLALLKEKDLLEQGEIKLYYLELTNIIRRYLGKKFEFDAMDLTTSEIDEYLNSIEFPDTICREFIEFLADADLIKFAKHKPEADQPDEDWQKTYRFINDTKDIPVIKPEPEPDVKYIPPIQTDENTDDEWRYAPPGYKDMMLAIDQSSTDSADTAEEEARE
ncbi:MAG: hypothetical protein KAR42_14515 [candidate division Zixibacteria bacterium]|nr:hypothetical protein [candidate division Zixibacteria bacterium]